MKKPNRFLPRFLVGPLVVVAVGVFAIFNIIGPDQPPIVEDSQPAPRSVEMQPPIEQVSVDIIKAFISGAPVVSFDQSQFEVALEERLDKGDCLDFLHLAEALLDKIESMKPAEPNADTERSRAVKEHRDRVIGAIKEQVLDADYCRTLIKGLAELAVDAAFGNNDSRSRQ